MAVHLSLLLAAVTTALVAAACSDDPAGSGADSTVSATTAVSTDHDSYPDVVGVSAEFDAGSESWTFDVTISSPYDSPERYADGWRVVGGDGTVFGVHTLAHHHATEQPFTRRQSGVVIPRSVTSVTIEGRDLVNGFGGETLTVEIDRDTP